MRGQRLDEREDDFGGDDELADDELADDDAGGTELVVRPPTVVAQRTPPAYAPPTRVDLAKQRARMLPYIATGATGAIGTVTWWAAELAEQAGNPDLASGITLGVCGASVAGVGALRLRYRDRIDGWNATWWTSAIASAIGVNLVTTTGPAALAAVAAAGAAIALKSGWMVAHDVDEPRLLPPPPPPRPLPPPPPPPPLPKPPPIPVDPRHPLHRRWDERVAAGEKAVLKDAELIPLELLPQAAKWKIDTNGDFTFDEIAAAQKKIAARLGILARNVIIERDGEEEGSALLTIVLSDTVLTTDLTYPGPQYIGGQIPVAMAADGTGWLHHVADDPEKGCQPGLIVGEPGSGKTAAAETVVAGKKTSGVWDVLYADGDPGGGSSPTLNALADRAFAGPQGALRVLEGLEAAIEYRSHLKPRLRHNPQTGLLDVLPPGSTGDVREMHATHQFHGIAGVFEEFHRLAEDEWLQGHRFIKRIERVARIGRKYGVVLDVVTQSLLSADFGLSTNLRAYLAARNAWILRSQNQSEGNALNGVAGAASSLPPQPGSCYAAGSQRMVLARIAWEKGLERYASRFVTTPGDRGTAMAIAVALAGQRRPGAVNDSDEALDSPGRSLEEIEAELAAGRNPFVAAPDEKKDGAKTAPAPQGPTAGQRAQQPQRFRTAGGAGIPAPLTGATVTQLRPPAAPAQEPAKTVPAHTATSRRVLAWLQANPGDHRTGAVATALEMSKSDASTALGVLAARGEAWKPKGVNGTYAAVEDAARPGPEGAVS